VWAFWRAFCGDAVKLGVFFNNLQGSAAAVRSAIYAVEIPLFSINWQIVEGLRQSRGAAVAYLFVLSMSYEFPGPPEPVWLAGANPACSAEVTSFA